MGRLIFSSVEAPEEQIAGPDTGGSGWIVVVLNNDHNTYAEVMAILIIATECDEHEAYIETWEIDHLGKSVVHYAGEEECQRVARIIATIGIDVEVQSEI